MLQLTFSLDTKSTVNVVHAHSLKQLKRLVLVSICKTFVIYYQLNWYKYFSHSHLNLNSQDDVSSN